MNTALFLSSAGNDPGKAESLSNRIRKYFERWIAVLWPRACFVCGETAGNAVVCHACEPMLVRLPKVACPRCALPVPLEGVLCGQCQRREPQFDATLAAFVYTHPVREMVLALKHGHGFDLLDYLGRELADTFVTSHAVDCIVPVPLHARRLTQRGFNQSCELAQQVALEKGVPLLRQAVLRDVDTPKFLGLRGKQRRRVVRGVFRSVKDFKGLHVLVIDDVMTSGATLDEMARTLKQRGATRVTNLVLARTLRESRQV
jgi:ComF family protein